MTCSNQDSLSIIIFIVGFVILGLCGWLFEKANQIGATATYLDREPFYREGNLQLLAISVAIAVLITLVALGNSSQP